jgi:CMP-N,N'-diacetyllegionaminic acid synthase
MNIPKVLGIIPARAGSKGIPEKNIQLLAGMPLIAHSILMAKSCPQITKCIVSTDSEKIAAIAHEYGGDVPFLRPAELARDDTPMWPVVKHALSEMESREHCRYDFVLLLSPTCPVRFPEDVARAIHLLGQDSRAVGVVAASRPAFNPRWVCVDLANDGYMRQSFPDGNLYTRRQDVPEVFRINGVLYLWMRDHVADSEAPHYFTLPHRLLEISEDRAIDIDTANDLRLAELLLRNGIISLPWLRL